MHAPRHLVRPVKGPHEQEVDILLLRLSSERKGSHDNRANNAEEEQLHEIRLAHEEHIHEDTMLHKDHVHHSCINEEDCEKLDEREAAWRAGANGVWELAA